MPWLDVPAVPMSSRRVLLAQVVLTEERRTVASQGLKEGLEDQVCEEEMQPQEFKRVQVSKPCCFDCSQPTAGTGTHQGKFPAAFF